MNKIKGFIGWGISMLLLSQVSWAQVGEDPDWTGGTEVIQEKISMGCDTVKACIDEKVILSCSDEYKDKDILEYQWINKTTKEVIGTTRSIEVRPQATTTYQLKIKYTLSHEERIVNGDFEKGEDDCYWYPQGREWRCTSFASDYRYVHDNTSTALHPEGTYKIVKNTGKIHMYFVRINDHTYQNGEGYMIAVNGSPSPTRNKVVWKQTVHDGIVPGRQYAFSAWVANVGGWVGEELNGGAPMLDFSINDNTLGGPYEYFCPPFGGQWVQIYRIWTADATSARISLINKTISRPGNDFAVDDISFAPVVEGVGEVEVKVLPQVDLEALANPEVCEGEDLTIDAHAVGSGTLVYSWLRKRDNVEVSNRSVLTISRAEALRDGGAYTCRVQGTCGEKQADFNIAVRKNVRYRGPEPDSIILCEDNLYLRLFYGTQWEGDDIREYCYSAKVGNTWLEKGSSVTPGITYVVRNNKDWLGSVHRCKAIGRCGADSVEIPVQIDDGDVFWKVSRDTTVCKGAPVRLYAHILNGKGTVTWETPDGKKWQQNEIEIIAGESPELYSYEIEKNCKGKVGGKVQVNVYPELRGLTVTPKDTNVCPKGQAIFKATAQGGANLQYDWAYVADGNREVSENLNRLVFSQVSPQDTGNYIVTVKDRCENSFQEQVHLGLIQQFNDLKVTPPVKACEGETVTLELTGKGTGTIKYEWQDPHLQRTSGKKLILPEVTSKDAGEYICIAKGICPEAKQFNTSVSLKKPLQVLAGDLNIRECPGENVQFSLQATGENVTVTWLKEGINKGTGNTLALNRISEREAGNYECQVHSDCGDTTLIFHLELKETTQIKSFSGEHLYVREGEEVVLFVNATGEDNVYTWTKNGVPVVGEGNRLTEKLHGIDQEYTYVATVTGACGTVSQTMKLSVKDYQIVEENMTARVCEGEDYIFVPKGYTGSTGDAMKDVRWMFNGNIVSSKPALELEHMNASQEGVYVCYCENKIYYLTVVMIRRPFIGGIRCDQAIGAKEGAIEVCEGMDVRLAAQITNSGFHAYEWTKDGKPIPGGLDSVLVLNNIGLDEGGVYACRVINPACGDDTKEITVRVRRKLTVYYLPKVEGCKGQVNLQVVAEGDSPCTFRWSGPNSMHWASTVYGGYQSVYTNLSATAETDNGTYLCKISNSCGEQEVSITLELEKELKLLSQTQDTTLCRGAELDLLAKFNVENLEYTWILPDGTVAPGKQERLHIGDYQPYHEGVNIFQYNVNTKNCYSRSGQIRLSMHQDMGGLTIHPESKWLCEGDSVRYTAVVQGDQLEYIWRGPKGFVQYSGFVEFAPALRQQEGLYELLVTDVCGEERRGKIDLTFYESLGTPAIKADTTVCEGEAVKLSVNHSGKATYEWSFREQVVGRGKDLFLPAVSPQDTGEYICRLEGDCEQVTLKTKVSFIPNLVVQMPETKASVCIGSPVTFQVSATGTEVRYEWYRDGLVQSRDSTLSFEEVIPTDGGIYHCRVLAACGTPWEQDYQLQVKEKTQLTSYTRDRFMSEHDSIRLVARASGVNNHFTWWYAGEQVGEGNEYEIKDVGTVDTLYYKVIVEGDCGRDSAWVRLKIGPFRPLNDVHSPDTLCEQSTYTYLANAIPDGCYGDEEFQFAWSFRASGATGYTDLAADGPLLRLEELTIAQSGSYRCRITGSCGTKEVNWEIHVLPLPALTLTEDAFIIEGADHEIRTNATGEELTYTWFLDDELYPATGEKIEFTPVTLEDQGVYRVVASNRCGNAEGRSELRVWRKTTVLTQDYEVALCQGMDTTLQVSALGVGLTYSWYHQGNLLTVPLAGTLEIAHAQEKDAGEYICIVYGRGGGDTCRIQLNVLALPEVDIAGPMTICPNDLTQEYKGIVPEGRIVYAWSAGGGEITGRNEDPEVEVKWKGGGEAIVALQVTDLATGCINRTEKQVGYYPLPDVSLVLPDTVGACLNTLPLNQAYPSGGYYVVNGMEAASILFEEEETIYAVEYYYTAPETGCRMTARDTVITAAAPYIQLVEHALEVGWCYPVVLEVEEHSPGNVVWSGIGELDLSDPWNPVYQAKEDTEQEAYFEVKLKDNYGCEASDEILITLLPSPVVTLGQDTVIGMCNDLVLEASYYSAWPDRIEWSPQEGLEPGWGNSMKVVEKQVGITDYILAVTDIFGCVGRDTVQVTVQPFPALEGEEVCAGDSIVVEARPGVEFIWQDGWTENNRVLKMPGRYGVTVKDEYHCEGYGEYAIHSLPVVHLSDTVIYEGQETKYVVADTGIYEPYSFEWQDGSLTPDFVAREKGVYWVKVMDNLGCIASDSAYVDVLERAVAAPDAFLPNSSGENSRFYLKEVNFGSRFEMYIYDRWGELLFKTDEIGFNGGWNGTFKGVDCQPGAYVWAAYIDGKEIAKGTVMLIR